MNLNPTLSDMAAQAKLQELNRCAERGWMAEQAAAHGDLRKRDVRAAVTRWVTAIVEAPHRVVRRAAGIKYAAASPGVLPKGVDDLTSPLITAVDSSLTMTVAPKHSN
jgi:hypothetical protein